MRKQHVGWKGPVAGTTLVLAVGASFLGSGVILAEESSRDDAREHAMDRERSLDDSRRQDAGTYLSLEEIAARVAARESGEIREIEREGAVYEVELYHADRERTELEVDARTGAVLRRHSDD